jgi:hypothetical protein
MPQLKVLSISVIKPPCSANHANTGEIHASTFHIDTETPWG